MIGRVRESRNPKKVIWISLMESYGEIGRVPVNLSKIVAKLLQLPVCIGYKAVPQLRVFLNGIVHISCGRCSEITMPVIITVPVGFGKINGNGHSPFPEFFIQAARDIGIRTCMEGTGRSGNLIIGSRGIKHTEAVMVLGGEKKVFETAFLSQLCPFIRTEFYRIEGFVGIDILLLEGFNIGPVHIHL